MGNMNSLENLNSLVENKGGSETSQHITRKPVRRFQLPYVSETSQRINGIRYYERFPRPYRTPVGGGSETQKIAQAERSVSPISGSETRQGSYVEWSGLRIHWPHKPYKVVKWEPAIDQRLSVIVDPNKGKASVGFRVGNIVYIVAKNLKQQQAEKLLANISQGNIELEKLSEQKWEEYSKGIGEVLGEVFTESATSIAEGIVGAVLFAVFGPVPAIALSLGMAVAAEKRQVSVGPGILAGTLTSTFGAVPAIAFSLGAATAISKLCRDDIM